MRFRAIALLLLPLAATLGPRADWDVGAGLQAGQGAPPAPDRRAILDTMKRATAFMVDKVSTRGGYLWTYLPDLSRRWGELEALSTQIWIQAPGTATMGHLFLDAYHATKDEYYYHAAEKVAGALEAAQHPSGGWDYLHDFAGERSLREWYGTFGRNAWRMEEFQRYWGNATFDDAGTIESGKFFLRLYVEKRNRKYEAPLRKALRFVLDSQYPVGGWPQRFPPPRDGGKPVDPTYTGYITFNDDVAAENLDFLVMYYQALGDRQVLDPIARGMNLVVVTQQPMPQPGWGLQYTLDLKPAGARTYEPNSLATHTTASNVGLLLKFYRLTGDAKFLARVPEALEWLDGLRLPPGIAPGAATHPTFIELGTNKPLYVHRSGSNVVNGRYYADYSPAATIGHYSAFRRIDVDGLRDQYTRLKSLPAAEVTAGSPLASGAARIPLPRFFALDPNAPRTAADVVAGLNAEGYWLVPLLYNSHPFRRHGTKEVAPGDFATTHVGDHTDTSPFPDKEVKGISTAAYIRNMSALIRALDADDSARTGR